VLASSTVAPGSGLTVTPQTGRWFHEVCAARSRLAILPAHARARPPGFSMKVNELLTLDIVDLALGGKALARHEGRVVFVDRGLPGDRVRARTTRVKRGFAEARLEAIEGPSPARVPAPCPHFRDQRCGGCRFQDLGYPAQLAAKER